MARRGEVSAWEVAGWALGTYVAVGAVTFGILCVRFWWEDRARPTELEELEPCPECGQLSAAVSVGLEVCDDCHQAQHGV